jgi:hypothetical protein
MSAGQSVLHGVTEAASAAAPARTRTRSRGRRRALGGSRSASRATRRVRTPASASKPREHPAPLERECAAMPPETGKPSGAPFVVRTIRASRSRSAANARVAREADQPGDGIAQPSASLGRSVDTDVVSQIVPCVPGLTDPDRPRRRSVTGRDRAEVRPVFSVRRRANGTAIRRQSGRRAHRPIPPPCCRGRRFVADLHPQAEHAVSADGENSPERRSNAWSIDGRREHAGVIRGRRRRETSRRAARRLIRRADPEPADWHRSRIGSGWKAVCPQVVEDHRGRGRWVAAARWPAFRFTASRIERVDRPLRIHGTSAVDMHFGPARRRWAR